MHFASLSIYLFNNLGHFSIYKTVKILCLRRNQLSLIYGLLCNFLLLQQSTLLCIHSSIELIIVKKLLKRYEIITVNSRD